MQFQHVAERREGKLIVTRRHRRMRCKDAFLPYSCQIIYVDQTFSRTGGFGSQ